MRRGVSMACACCWLVVGAASGACAENPPVQCTGAQSTSAQSTSTWDWLLGYLLDRILGIEKEPAATALARLGGSCLVLRADTAKLNAAILDDLRGDVRRVMRGARIPYSSLTARDGGLDVRVREPGDLPRAMTALATGPSGGALDLRDMGDGLIRLAPTPSDLDDRLTAALNQTIDTIRQRLQGLGATPAGVERHGADRILILLPGNKDPTRLAQVLLPKSELEFRLIDVSISPDAAQRNGAPPDAEVLYGFKIKYPYVVKTHVEIGGQDIADANASIDSRTQAPVVAFRFTPRGSRLFAQITQENVGRAFAIVLDHEVISAPIIREPILGGTGQISGNFTVEEASDLASRIRAGALPLGLIVVEQQVIEPAQKP